MAGSVLLSGGDFYDLPGPLQFLYPPFAAVLAVPLAVSFPRLHPAWAIPLCFWLVPGTYNGGTWQVAVALTTAGSTMADIHRVRVTVQRTPTRSDAQPNGANAIDLP